MIYLVTEEAVYRHRILGVYDSQEAAEARALEVAMKEDAHHEYCVWSASLNAPMTDPEEICGYKRKWVRGSAPAKYSDPERQPAV